MKETDLAEPNSYYAVAKLSQTMLCQYTARAKKRPIVTLRLFSVYGPYEDPSRLMVTIIRRCLNGEALEMTSPHTARDFIFVEDVVDAYLNIEKLQVHPGEIFNIGTGKQTNLKELTQLLLTLSPRPVDVKWNAMRDRIWDASIWIADTHKTKEVLGWQAKTNLEQGLKKTMAWIKQQ